MFNDYLENSNLTLGSNYMSKLVIFLFIIAGNYVGDIYSCSLRHYFNNNMIIKHIIGVFIMFVFVGSVEDSVKTLEKIGLSLVFYVWFILIMRTRIIYTLIILALICILFVLESHMKDLQRDDEKKNEKNILFYKKLMNLIFLLSILISIIGFISFYIYARKNFKNFSAYEFLKGSRDQECFTNKFAKLFSKNKIGNIPQKIKKRMIIT
jgi:hypothetical protein